MEEACPFVLEDIKHVYDWFKFWDEDQDGFLTLDDMAEGLTEGYADVFPDFHRARLYLDSVVGDIPSKMAINDSAHGFWILRLRILKDVKEVQEFDVVPPSAPPLPPQDDTSFIPTFLSNFINPDTGRERREEIAAGSSSSCAVERQNSHSADVAQHRAPMEEACPFVLGDIKHVYDWFKFWDEDQDGFLTLDDMAEGLTEGYADVFPDFHRARFYLDSVVGDIPSKMAINDSARGFWILRHRILKHVEEVQERELLAAASSLLSLPVSRLMKLKQD